MYFSKRQVMMVVVMMMNILGIPPMAKDIKDQVLSLTGGGAWRLFVFVPGWPLRGNK